MKKYCQSLQPLGPYSWFFFCLFRSSEPASVPLPDSDGTFSGDEMNIKQEIAIPIHPKPQVNQNYHVSVVTAFSPTQFYVRDLIFSNRLLNHRQNPFWSLKSGFFEHLKFFYFWFSGQFGWKFGKCHQIHGFLVERVRELQQCSEVWQYSTESFLRWTNWWILASVRYLKFQSFWFDFF